MPVLRGTGILACVLQAALRAQLGEQSAVEDPARQFVHYDVFFPIAIKEFVSRKNTHQDLERFPFTAIDSETGQRGNDGDFQFGPDLPLAALLVSNRDPHPGPV